MNIAINTLHVGTAGGRDYARYLIQYICPILEDSDNLIVITKRSDIKCFSEVNSDATYICGMSHKGIKRIIWEQIKIPTMIKKYQIDILYNLSVIDNFLAPCKTVIKIGNMAPYEEKAVEMEKNLKNKLRLHALRYIAKLSSYKSSAVLTMSDTARKTLLENGFAGHKVFGIFHSADVEDLRGNSINIDEDFILIISHIDRYKMLDKVIKAYNKVYSDNKVPNLIIAGMARDKKYFNELIAMIGRFDLEKKVRLLGNVSRNSLYNLYVNCKFLIFPSIVETCPRTLIEALKCGTPIMCSNRSVMPELCGNAALYFNPEDINDIEDKMRKMLDKGTREDLYFRSIERGKIFSWEKTARETIKVFEEVYNSGR